MATIVTRAGKGSPLTNAEVDVNFTNLNTELGQKLVTSDLAPYLLTATAAATYQLILTSGTSIKTVNGQSVLGSGNIQIDGGVTSFNTRTGAVSLSSGDVTTALGFTPYNSTNPSGYITSSALSSYLPLSGGSTTGSVRLGGGNASPGSTGFSHTIAAVGGSNRTVNFDGNGTAPSVWWTNGSRALFAIDALSAGGASFWANNGSTWQQQMEVGFGYVNVNANAYMDFGPNNSWGATLRVGGNGHTGGGRASVVTTDGNLHLDGSNNSGVYLNWYNSGATGTYFGNGAGGQVGRVDPSGNASFSGAITQAGNQVLHAGNVGTYALPITGGTVSGVITSSISNGTVLNMAGQSDSFGYNGVSGFGTYIKGTGSTYIYGGGKFWDGSTAHTLLHAGNYTGFSSIIRALGYPSSGNNWDALGNDYANSVIQVTPSNFSSTPNGPTAASYTYGTLLNFSSQSSSKAQIYISHNGNDLIFRGGWDSATWQTWNKVLTNQNYTSYAPSLTGGGASGTWGISISGSAAQLGGVAASDYFRSDGSYPNDDMNTPVEGYWHVRSYAAGLPEGYYGHRWDYDHLNNGQWVAQMYSPTGGDPSLWFRQRRDYGWQTWRKMLDSSNYSSYAPGLTGSGASGTWGISVTGSANSLNLSGHTISNNSWAGGGGYHGYQFNGGNYRFGFSSTGGVVDVYADGNFYATDSSHLVLHAGNYSSYALPLSGGTLSGPTKIRAGHGNTRFQLHYDHDGNDNSGAAGYLTLWASEPGISYPYTGIGGNINLGGQYFGRQSSGQPYGLYLRFETSSGFSEFWSTSGTPGNAGGQGSRVAYIDAGGSGTFSGNVTAFSDERLKKDWSDLPVDFVERLANVKSGTYTRIDSGERQAGSSAQEWQSLLPEVVIASNDESKTLTLAYGNAALVSAIELAKDNVELRARIERLEALVEKLIGG